jgi:hypothetical protein
MHTLVAHQGPGDLLFFYEFSDFREKPNFKIVKPILNGV